ncbi:PapD-like protein [Mycotypha africana]|uniref:PapD-like protein n=1 Tax=Mycotypha africana TaxID=64632 RepID=UPI00230134A3|nr:PapD-like protein [Mycotypha africana]KAI8979172.1 PapD-like protein [Mycotypha africana]
MSIELNIGEYLEFERPLTRVVKRDIRISNPNNEPIAFKVKTTAPRLYCVRPNSDIVPANSYVDVQIMLQAFKEEPPMDAKCRDKFLILSTFLNDTIKDMTLPDLWTYVEANEKQNIRQHKLRCVFVPAKDTEQTAAPASPAHNVDTTHYTQSTSPSNIAISDINSSNATSTTNMDDSSNNNRLISDTEVSDKMKKVEAELNDVKRDVNALSSAEATKVAERAQQTVNAASQQQAAGGLPLGMLILIALIVAAIAYFYQSKN